MLDEVRVIPRTYRSDGRGWLLKVLDGSESGLPEAVGEVYLTLAMPTQSRGGHFHQRTAEWFTVVQGSAELRLADPQTSLQRKIALSAEEARTIYVPPGVAHLFVNTGSKAFLIVAYASRRYDPADTLEYTFE